MKKIVFIILAITSPVFGANALVLTDVPESQNDWSLTVAALQKEVPEFKHICRSFPSTDLKSYQSGKTKRSLTIVAQIVVARKYLLSLIYTVTCKPGLSSIEKIDGEHLGFFKIADLAQLPKVANISPINFTRADLEKIALEGDKVLDELYTKNRANQALQPTTTAVIPAAEQPVRQP